MTYAEASRALRKSAVAVASAHLALLVLDVAVMTSALPYVYVNDGNANCGARFLTRYAGGNVLQSGGLAIAALIISLIFTEIVRVRRLEEKKLGNWGGATAAALTFGLGVIAIVFFLSAFSQVGTLRYPPMLPKNVSDVRACTELK